MVTRIGPLAPYDVEVLVIGAGPTGLVMASELTRHGVSCRIIDKAPHASEQSKALIVQCRSLEVLHNMGVAAAAVAAGHQAPAINLFVEGHRATRIAFEGLNSPYPSALFLSQRETERILTQHLESLGVTIERAVSLSDFEQDEDEVSATLVQADERIEKIRTGWIIGCDGAYSQVRHTLDLPFEGASYEEDFILADLEVDWPYKHEEAYLFLTGGDILGVAPLPGDNHYRLTATRSKAMSESAEVPDIWKFQALVEKHIPVKTAVRNPTWLTRFKLHRRIVPQLQVGRAFVVGDAAHIHSPAGGQGLNTGIQDAYNLAWKLALVIQGTVPADFLTSYSRERHPVAENVLNRTDRFFRFALSDHYWLRQARRWLMPLLAGRKGVQRRIRDGISELDIAYRHSPIVEERLLGEGGPRAGDRAPDATITYPENITIKQLFDLFQHTTGVKHIALLLSGERPSPDIYHGLTDTAKAIRDRFQQQVDTYLVIAASQIPNDLTWDGDTFIDRGKMLHQQYQAKTARIYLIRPDGYVAFRSAGFGGGYVTAYLERLFG